MSERFIAGWGGYPLVGTPEQVVEGMKQVGEAGMGGMIMGMIDPDKEFPMFKEEIVPLMVKEGIRH
jgi:alkanesulfonate monooxygenase SsuD/methylene tetrahydromethanopterin reductase-like flavin-dependent oxidoreductase (luciferase family)